MLDAALVDAVLKRALQSGADLVELFVERKRNQSIAFEESRVERVNSGHDSGAGIRIIHGTVISYVYTEDLSEAGLLKTADLAAAVGRRGGGVFSVAALSGTPAPVSGVKVPPDSVSTDRKIQLLKDADETARSRSGLIRQVSLGYGETTQEVLIATSEGLRHQDQRTRVRLMAQVVAGRNGDIQTATEAPGAQVGFELFDRVSPVESARIAADRAVRLLDAQPSPAGTMPVVMGNEFGGVLFHEACGHGLEADFVSKGSTVYTGKLGEKVASDILTAIDDGSQPTRWGSGSVDDEGTPTRRTVLIDHGVLRSYLHDRRSAGKQGLAVTGNGRRQSYQHLPIPRMSNTFIAPGSASRDEILAATPRGLYARKLGGGQVDPITGDFVFAVTEGFLIENGHVGPMVRGATLVGNGPKTLHKVDMIGNDLELAPGTCGKDGQSVPVSVGQPTLRISELTVGGTAAAGRQA